MNSIHHTNSTTIGSCASPFSFISLRIEIFAFAPKKSFCNMSGESLANDKTRLISWIVVLPLASVILKWISICTLRSCSPSFNLFLKQLSQSTENVGLLLLLNNLENNPERLNCLRYPAFSLTTMACTNLVFSRADSTVNCEVPGSSESAN